jgi:uncharacterized SAM-binding protein YcdF (DUF218 family)
MRQGFWRQQQSRPAQMSSLYNTLSLLLLPPQGFLYLIVGGLLTCHFFRAGSRSHRSGAMAAGAGLLLLTICLLPITATMLRRGLEAGLPPLDFAAPEAGAEVQYGETPPRAIVLLAGDTVGNQFPGGLLAGPQPGPLSMGRLRAAVGLARTTHLPVLITGQNMVQGSNVSDMMRRVMVVEYQLPPDQVPQAWVDHNAHDTWENADNANAILLHAGIRSAYVVTDGWHMRRTLLAFRHTGLHVTPAPVALTRAATPIFSDFIPRVSAGLETYYAVHEWLGCAYYAIFYK